MCLGIPAEVVSVGTDHPDVALVNSGGVLRSVNVGLLDGSVAVGDWVLVHLGFALSTMTMQEAGEALSAFRDERLAEATGHPPEETGHPPEGAG